MHKVEYNIKTGQKQMRFSLTFLIKITAILHICFTQGFEKDILLQIDQIDRQIQEIELQIAIIDAGYVQEYTNNNRDYQRSVASQYARTQTKSDKNTKFKKIEYEDLEISKSMTIHCQIPNSQIYNIFQTPRSSYIVINIPKTNQFQIYNSECFLISHLKHNQVQKILCDRGLCDDGNIIILTRNNTLVACSEMSNFTDCSVIHNLNGKVKGSIVGATVRGRGGGQVEVYVADSEGQIMVFDGQGKLKLTLSIEQDSKISHFADIHPHPIAISSKGWIYNFQINKYSLSLTKCPYLFHPINHIFISHPYSSLIYALSERAISIIDLKSQSKGCEVTQRFYPIQHIGELALDKHPHVAEYQGKLYIENKIINLQNATVYELCDCANTRFNFQQMKNNYRKGFFTMSCSASFQQNSTSSLLIFKQHNSEQSSNKNNTIIIIIILLLIVFLIFLFLRSTVPNLDYDEELRYSQKIRYRTEVGETLQGDPDMQEVDQKNTNARPKDTSASVRNSKEKQQRDQNYQKTLTSRKKDE